MPVPAPPLPPLAPDFYALLNPPPPACPTPRLPAPQASDQYLLEGLKRLCEMSLAQSLTPENLTHTFDLSEAYSAPQLAKRCALSFLEHYEQVQGRGRSRGKGGFVPTFYVFFCRFADLF